MRVERICKAAAACKAPSALTVWLSCQSAVLTFLQPRLTYLLMFPIFTSISFSRSSALPLSAQFLLSANFRTTIRFDGALSPAVVCMCVCLLISHTFPYVFACMQRSRTHSQRQHMSRISIAIAKIKVEKKHAPIHIWYTPQKKPRGCVKLPHGCTAKWPDVSFNSMQIASKVAKPFALKHNVAIRRALPACCYRCCCCWLLMRRGILKESLNV